MGDDHEVHVAGPRTSGDTSTFLDGSQRTVAWIGPTWDRARHLLARLALVPPRSARTWSNIRSPCRIHPVRADAHTGCRWLRGDRQSRRGVLRSSGP